MRTTTSLFLNSLTGSTFLSLATTASASSPHHHSSLFQLSTPTQPFPSPPASPDTATTTSSCDVTASSSTLSSINTIFKCLDLSELNLSALNHLQSVDLSSCSLNLQQCQSIIQHEIAQHPNSLFAQMISKLTNSPDQACPCITSAASNECLPILNHLSSYCELIQSSSSSSTSPIVALSTCSDILHNICPTHSNFQDAFSCLEGHLTELEGKCSIPLNAMMANVYTDCQHDISSLCSSNYVISCLQDNFEVLSSQCQSQVPLLRFLLSSLDIFIVCEILAW